MSTLAFQPAAERFYAEGHWRPGDLWSEFAARAQQAPAKVALHAGARMISYGELRQAAAALSDDLAGDGVAPGDVVLLLGRNSIEAGVALLACMHLGAVAAPLPPMFGAQQLAALARQAGAVAIIAFGGEAEFEKSRSLSPAVPIVRVLLADEVPALAARPEPGPRRAVAADSLAILLHSSGTTSVPKAIMHSANTLRYATEQILARWELGREDVNLVVCEFGFVGSLVFGYLVTLLSGATGVLLPRWSGDDALQLIERHACTYVLYMPTHGADILRAGRGSPRNWSSLRVLVATGLSQERRAAVREVFGHAPIADYGLSEVPGHIAHSLSEPWEKTLRTEGIPFPGTTVEILGTDDRPLPSGDVGAVVVNGPSRFLGFLGNPELTRESLTASGGYRTGDLGVLDEDGHFLYAGRSKDIIRRGGVTLVPAEIEATILRHPSVHEVAIIPVPDDRLGERACAALILKPGAAPPDLLELQEFLQAEGVAKYSWPESIEVFDEFPRTPSLKVVKRDVVSAVLTRAGAAV